MIRVDLNASNFISQSHAEETTRSMKMQRDSDLEYRKESLLLRKEAQHREEQALAENRLQTALDWGDIEKRRRHTEANWRNGSFRREMLRLQESYLREDELRLQLRDFKERIEMSQRNTENSLRKTESEFPGMRKLREQYIQAALRSLQEVNDPSIEHLNQVKRWLQDMLQGKRVTLLALPRLSNIKGTLRGEVMGQVVHCVGIGVLCFFTTYSSFFLFKEFDHRVWQADGMKLETYFAAPVSCALSCLVYKLFSSVWNPWERIKEKFMERAKERCISRIKEKAGCVIQVEFTQSSKEVCMTRACRIMQEARPAVQEALRGIKAHRQRLLVIHRPQKDLLDSKEAACTMYKALRPIKKALSPLLPFITSADDQVALSERWHQSCINEAHRLVDTFWDSELIPCLFSQGRIKQAKIELVIQAYRLISKKSGLFPIEKELLLRIQEIDQAISETTWLKKVALFPIQQAQERMHEVDQEHHLLLQKRLEVDRLRKKVSSFTLSTRHAAAMICPALEQLSKKNLKNAEKSLRKMEERIVFQNNPTSLQKKCIETIYLQGLDHGLDCDVQNQIDELFQHVSMPAQQEMTNLHNYIFMGWGNST